MTRTTNAIGFDLNNYYNKTEVNYISNFSYNFTTQQSKILNTKINTKQDILKYYPIDPSLYYNKTEVNNISYFNSNFTTQQSNILYTAINTKEAILTFLVPLTQTTNTIGIDLNSYVPYAILNSCNYITNATSTLINYFNKTESDGRFFKLKVMKDFLN